MLPVEAARLMRDGELWGTLTFHVSDPDNAATVSALSQERGGRVPVRLSPKLHFLHSCDARPHGWWYRAPTDLHLWWYLCARQQVELKYEAFRQYVASAQHPGAEQYMAITFAPGAPEAYSELQLPEFAAWVVSRERVSPIAIEVEPETRGVRQLAVLWPVPELKAASVLVVGVGSIGGAAAHALAGYGVGELHLLDPDRLLWNNLVRHVCGDRHVGRLKVDALKIDIEGLRPDTRVQPHPLDVAQDADQVRALLERVDLVLCTADGVAPRRVVSHLARRAWRDAVLACVLENGGLGEILRFRPAPDRGCLMCQREALQETYGMDPEPAIDAGYGAGTRHRSMTAVGPDLHAVGQLAAKAAVATLLERKGYSDQRLAGEHVLLGLRPQPGWAAPFDLTRAGQVRWLPATPPRPTCPTCEAP
jgi:NAD(P)-dependent dehydrogenase (short-subunit alcohol dehydrogenase family)